VLLLATCSGIGRYAAAMFSVHIAAHMLVSMLVPALLVLGAPLTLARALRGERGPLPRPSEWLLMVAGSRAVRLLTHPIVALLLFAGSPFALYFTGLYDVAVRFHWAHLAIDAWFLGTGYLFLWPVIGVDATARPTPNLARLGMLLAAMPADIVFGAALMGTHRVIGNGVASANMYQALALPWVPDLAADQRLAGLLALILGELALFVVLAALLARWNTVDDIDEPSRALLETRHAN
jgi:putative copper resistance protein D